jgi:hypothetical protein
MVWNDFVRLFHKHHIPNSVMKLKQLEFMSLKWRNLSMTEYVHKCTELSHYALYEVDTDEKKKDSFLCGFDPELRTLIGAGVYPDFNTMVSKAVTTAKNKQDEMRDRKRKFEAKKMHSQEKTLKLQQPTFSSQKSCSKVSYQAPAVSYRPPTIPVKTQGSFQKQ